jgi:hypothetical protein
MSSDLEMGDPANPGIDLDPAIVASVTPAPEQVIHKYREYLRHPGIRAAETPSVIWSVGEEYRRNKKKYWRCGICKKTKMLAIDKGTTSALRHLRRDHKIDKKGRRI